MTTGEVHSHRCLNCGRTWACPGDCQTAGGRCLQCGSLIADWERAGESVDFRHQATEKGEPSSALPGAEVDLRGEDREAIEVESRSQVALDIETTCPKCHRQYADHLGDEIETICPLPPTLDATLAAAFAWFDRVIPHTAEADVKKFREEADEFVKEPSIEEAADVVLCITHWAHLMGLDLHGAIKAKMEKNRGRKWQKRPDGTWHHVKPGGGDGDSDGQGRSLSQM